MRPVSVEAAATSFTGSPRTSPVHLERRLADLHLVALAQLDGIVDAGAVHQGAVRGADVFDPQVSVTRGCLGVDLRGERVERDRNRAAAAAPDRRIRGD